MCNLKEKDERHGMGSIPGRRHQQIKPLQPGKELSEGCVMKNCRTVSGMEKGVGND